MRFKKSTPRKQLCTRLKMVGYKTSCLMKKKRKLSSLRNQSDSGLKKTPMVRVIKQVTQDLFGADYRYSQEAIGALIEASESYLVNLFEGANICTLHAKRKTVSVQDVHLAVQLKYGTVPLSKIVKYQENKCVNNTFQTHTKARPVTPFANSRVGNFPKSPVLRMSSDGLAVEVEEGSFSDVSHSG